MGINLYPDKFKYQLETIEKETKDLQQCCYKMLSCWCNIVPEGNWGQLIDALSEIDLKAVATEIENKLKKGIATYIHIYT